MSQQKKNRIQAFKPSMENSNQDPRLEEGVGQTVAKVLRSKPARALGRGIEAVGGAALNVAGAAGRSGAEALDREAGRLGQWGKRKIRQGYRALKRRAGEALDAKAKDKPNVISREEATKKRQARQKALDTPTDVEMENSNQDPNLKEDKKHDGSISGQPATFKKGKELESTKGKGYRLVKKKWKLASEMENSNQDPNLKEAVSDSGTQLQRIYKSGELAGSGKFSGEKNHGEVQDQLDRIRNKGRKLALKDKKIKPKLKSKLMTPSQGGGDVATEKSLVKGITKGKAINRAIRALPK